MLINFFLRVKGCKLVLFCPVIFMDINVRCTKIGATEDGQDLLTRLAVDIRNRRKKGGKKKKKRSR